MSERSDHYVSTRGQAAATGFAQVLLRGMAPDGGLYMPGAWPSLAPEMLGGTYAEIARAVLTPFVGGALPAGAVERAVQRLVGAFDHPAVTPLVELESGLFLLELFHGPTAAFKDLAMQLVAAMADEAPAASGERLTLLTATSGDTGAAAVAAFAGSARIDLVVLHPLDRVSAVQRRQMTTSGADNVLNLAVRGDFDDCQRLVKALLAEPGPGRFSSVNSINWARLAGQVPYYVSAAAQLRAMGEPRAPHFVVPTGNLGDAFAGVAARRMGLPIARLTAAVNANDALARAIDDGVYVRHTTVETASVSMDVQAPSNFERLVFEASGRDAERTRRLFETFAREGAVALDPDLRTAIQAEMGAISINEAETRAEIAHAWKTWGRVVCPHTAVALAAARRRDRSAGPVVALATAHPSKFPEAVRAVLGFGPEPAPVIRRLTDASERLEIIAADEAAVRAAVGAFSRRKSPE
jgi:threonine synthase